MSGPVRQVGVVGGGVAAPMAALAVARAFGRLGTQVEWIDTGAFPPAHAALIVPPDMASFHRLLGVSDRALVEAASATFAMGQQFVGWSGGDGGFLHAYGDAGTAFESLPFVQHWVRARQAGLRVGLEDFCLAAAAAKEGRTGEVREPALQQAVKRGWHVDARRYAGLLRSACEAAGVKVRSGPVGNVRRRAEDGWVVSVDTVGGATIAADVFIDADGALANGGGADANTSSAPICDRMLRGSMAPFDPVPLFSRAVAHRAGWMTLIPLADRTAVEFSYHSGHMDEEAARAMLAGAGRGLVLSDTVEVIGDMATAQPWRGNRVAIGAASGGVMALDGAELLLLQLAIAQLVLLWPIDAAAMPEAGIYNDELTGSRNRIADFTAQHFRLNGREGEPFWDDARARPVSPELQAKIDLFSARGMFAHCAHEAHVEDAWALCMAGHGLVPRGFDPQAHRVGDQALMAEFQRQLRAISVAVRGMDTHDEALDRVKAGPA